MTRTKRRIILDRLPEAEVEQERWRPIAGYEGFYEVSDHGRIRGLDRDVGLNHSYGGAIAHHRVGLEMIASPTKNGRLHICLSRDGIARTFAVANLVLEAFSDGWPADAFAAPRDGDHNNCAADNLIWRKRRAGRAARPRGAPLKGSA